MIQEFPDVCFRNGLRASPFPPHHTEFWLQSFAADLELHEPSAAAGRAAARAAFQGGQCPETWGHPSAT